jgi:D-proline dehydrogenase
MRFAVVGAGIVGLFAAYHLRRQGVEVAVFDPLAPGARSVHAAGIIEPTRAYRTNTWAFVRRVAGYLKRGTSTVRSVDLRWLLSSARWLGRDPLPGMEDALARLADRSLEVYAAMAAERNDFDYRREGLLERYRDSRLFRAERASAEARAGRDPVEVNEEPGGGGSLFFPGLGWVHTERAVRRLVAEVGETAFVRRRVDTVATNGTVVTDGSAQRFDGVVVATGIAGRRLGLPLTAVRGYGWHLRSGRAVRCATIFVDEGVALAPFDGDLKATGGWQFDLSDDPSHAAPVLAAVRNVVPDAEVVSFDHGWRPCPPDGLPLVSLHERVAIANGGFRLGWSFAPALGAEAAELVLGQRAADPFLARFAPMVRLPAG